ncbi:hypothetical protein Hsw_0696 [Hymenobacter swuensis DY53]|uniref:Uncharacterized protein n=1 Tax=Hymenobacter swuensis DY53 TaxID=1227739 RepID=W8F125_9BACT|nr:hypothetical protein Hsw_0696 [Hymenobacter swuensis DY53]
MLMLLSFNDETQDIASLQPGNEVVEMLRQAQHDVLGSHFLANLDN